MTPEDLAQIAAVVTASEQRTAAAAAASEQRTADVIQTAVTASEQRTAAAVAASEQRTADTIQTAVTASEQRTSAAIQTAKDQTVEAMRDMQTEILRGLEAFARGNFARMHRLETSDADTNARITALEERVLMLETRPRPPQ